MWVHTPPARTPSEDQLRVIERELPRNPPYAWSLHRGEPPMLEVVAFDGGAVRDIRQYALGVLAPPPATTLDRYAAFVRAVARAYPELLGDALVVRVLDAPALGTEDELYRALVDPSYRARALHPVWAAEIAGGAGLPPPDARVAAVVGAFADAWSANDRALALLRAAAGEGDRVAGRYLLGLVEALIEWRAALGRPCRTDDRGEDLDLLLVVHALPLLELADEDGASAARIARIRALVQKAR